MPVRLIVVHYHYRPGGIRRIIEQGVRSLVRHSGLSIREVILAGGEAPDAAWSDAFTRALPRVCVTTFIEPALGYFADQHRAPAQITTRIRAALERLVQEKDPTETIVWAHNLGLGRNLMLSRELAAICVRQGVRLVSHHHDWWFDNRWQRWPELRRCGTRSLPAVAEALLPSAANICHVAINGADAAILRGRFRKHAGWLPNLSERSVAPSPERVRHARKWLAQQTGSSGPVWLLPCRLLRRKNVAEALLLTRWLRPEAKLVTTGGASSGDEQPYFQRLQAAARVHGWPVHLAILAGQGNDAPSVATLMAASEVVLLTSVQEGFGLPYLEAAVARRPLIARELPIIAPDLAHFGFRFPHLYSEVRVAPGLFDWLAEKKRQAKLFRAWFTRLPKAAQKYARSSHWLRASQPTPLPFSRLTFTAQLEVLAQPREVSWEQCLPLNPWLAPWRRKADRGTLKPVQWPREADRWLGSQAYGRHFAELVKCGFRSPATARAGGQAQQDFMRERLAAENLFPLLWTNES